MKSSLQNKYQKASQFSVVMAHPRRLHILDMLRQHGEIPVEDMLRELGITKASLSQHLAILRRKKLVHVRRDGRKKMYRLNHPDINTYCDMLHELCDVLR